MDTEPIAPDEHTRIDRERKDSVPEGVKWPDVKKYRDYARGRQRGTLNADQIRILQSVIGNKFSDNILRKILSEHTNRSRIARFDVDGERETEFLYMIWVKNQLPDLYAKAIYATLRDGNHALLLDWIPSSDPTDPWGGYVAISRERWWDGKEGIFVYYGDGGKAEYAVKEWQDGERRWRKNVYYPDAIHRYRSDGGSWQPYNLPQDVNILDQSGMPIRGIVPWRKPDDSPIGIPVIHLANGSDDDTPYGASLFAGGALAFQDQINAIQHDITAAAMLNGSPQTFSSGFDLPTDPNDPTKKLVPRTGPGAHHHTDEKDARWGTLSPGSLAELETAYDLKVSALCRNTNTPLHTISNQWPSGEALFRADMPIVQDTKNLADSVGPAMASGMHRATVIYNTFGTGPEIDENALIRTIFEAPELRDEIYRWDVATRAAAYVSAREVLRIAGYEPSRIDEIMEEKDDEAEANAQRTLFTFDRGPAIVTDVAAD